MRSSFFLFAVFHLTSLEKTLTCCFYPPAPATIGQKGDSLELWCLHRAYMGKITRSYELFYEQRSQQPKRKSTRNPYYPSGTHTRYELYNAWAKVGRPVTPSEIANWEAVGQSVWSPASRAPRPHEIDPARTPQGVALRQGILLIGGVPADCETFYLKLRAASLLVRHIGL